MWIDTRKRMPTVDGTYIVQVATGDVSIMMYTVEGRWNTYICNDGTLCGKGLEDEYVVRWHEVEAPPEVPEEWFEEWVTS